MNKITVGGILRHGEKKYAPGYEYHLDVTRKSGTVDSLLVLSPDENLPEGGVTITGKLRSEYIHGVGVPAFIVPDIVEPADEEKYNGLSEAVVTGTIKSDPKCRATYSAKSITSILLRTEEGMIPVLLWGGNAKKAEKDFKAGDRITVTGRMQSREYPDKNKVRHITYELSGSKAEMAEDE